jgi:hypothetical protein
MFALEVMVPDVSRDSGVNRGEGLLIKSRTGEIGG